MGGTCPSHNGGNNTARASSYPLRDPHDVENVPQKQEKEPLLGPSAPLDSNPGPSQGAWYHAAYHLATTIATPAAFAALPWAVAMLGWAGGMCALLMSIGVTLYNSLLLTVLHKYGGKCCTRYEDLSGAILGKWGRRSTIFFQQVASIGNNLATQIVAGQAAKAVYHSYVPDSSLTLQECIILFGLVQLVLSQLPDISSLRFLSLSSTFASLAFAGLATALCIVCGLTADRSAAGYYELSGSPQELTLSAFAALGTIAFGFCNTVLPEVMSTIRQPAERNMQKGINLAYAAISLAYIAVAASGYWAFGSGVNPFIVSSLTGPAWGVRMVLKLAILQIMGCYQMYTRPTFELMQQSLTRWDESPFSAWNAGIRAATTTLYMALITLVSCMIPFFSDFVALFGALGVVPINFVLPVLLYCVAVQPSRVWRMWNGLMAGLYCVVAAGAAAGAVCHIVACAKSYQLFADL